MVKALSLWSSVFVNKGNNTVFDFFFVRKFQLGEDLRLETVPGGCVAEESNDWVFLLDLLPHWGQAEQNERVQQSVHIN